MKSVKFEQLGFVKFFTMEDVYLPAGRDWVSDSMNVMEFHEKFLSLFDRCDLFKYMGKDRKNKETEYLQNVLGNRVDKQLLKRVARSCRYHRMVSPKEAEPPLNAPLVGPHTLVSRLQQGASNHPLQDEVEDDLHTHNDVLLVIRVYEPFDHIIGKRSVKPQWMQEVTVLGSHTLNSLKDRIMCPNDLAVPGEVSEEPFVVFEKGVTSRRCKLIYKSGFIYIGSTFYNDLRDPCNKDLSHVIRNWAETRGLGEFDVGNMVTATFDSLTLRLGYPYVFQHQGSCEHLLVFTDIRLLHPRDPLESSKYPLLRFREGRSVRYCMICGRFAATWLVIDSDRVPHNPCLYCAVCFVSFNYIDGRKLGHFSAYPYYDKAAVY